MKNQKATNKDASKTQESYAAFMHRNGYIWFYPYGWVKKEKVYRP